MKILRILVLFGLVSLLANSQAKADTHLSIVPPQTGPYPDLADGFVNVTYSSGSGDFVAQGWTQTYWNPTGTEFDTVTMPDDPNYTLDATITGAGVLLPGGTLTITGDIGSGNKTLLTGSLTPGAAGTAFGYGDGGNEVFQFLFTVTGGVEASAFGGSGWVDLYGGTWDIPFTSWTSDFSSASYDGNMDAQIISVPEPSSILVVASGVLCMVARRRLNATQA
jgi:hypothetical protein